jgi:type I restriction enzyme, S subunit
VKMQTLQLGDIVLSANPGFASGENPASGVVQLRMNNVSTDGTIDWSEIRRVPANRAKTEKYALAPGDVVFNSTNSPDLVGKTALFSGFKEPVVFSNHFLRIRVNRDAADPGYVAMWLSFQWKCRRFENLCTRWVNQASVRKEDLLDLQISLPQLSEQRRIVEQLDRADRLRHTRRYALELTDTFFPAAFLELFGDPEGNPLGWSESELGELCEEVLDCPHSTPIYTTIPTPHPCVRSSDIQRGYLDFSEAKYVSQFEYHKRIARGKPMPGDVIYCREGARFGNAGRILDKTAMCLGQRTMLFRANLEVALGEYIWAFLSSRAAYRQATRALDGSASPHVNVGEIVAFRVPVPPLTLQQRFALMCQRVDHMRTVQREALRQAEHLFASLLHRAFSS